MRKEETKALVRLVRHMQQLQRQVAKPTLDDATDEEVLTLFRLLWVWTPSANQELPGKHTVEKLVGLMRGCQPGEYCYISSQDVARIIRKESKKSSEDCTLPGYVILNKDADKMTDVQLYEDGRWNYKATPLVELLWDFQAHPDKFSI